MMLMPEGSEGAALLVRRTDGQFAIERIDARVACAVRAAARWSRKAPPAAETSRSNVRVSMPMVEFVDVDC